MPLVVSCAKVFLVSVLRMLGYGGPPGPPGPPGSYQQWPQQQPPLAQNVGGFFAEVWGLMKDWLMWG